MRGTRQRGICRAATLLLLLTAIAEPSPSALAQTGPQRLFLPLVQRNVPQQPGIVAHFGGSPKDLAVGAGHVYLADGPSIHAYSLAGDLAGSVQAGREGAARTGATDGGSPAGGLVGSSRPLPGAIQRLVFHAGKLYALLRADDPEEGSLIVLSTENPGRPQIIGRLDGLSDPQDIAISGSTAYLANGVAGLAVVELGQGHPRFLGQFPLLAPDNPYPGASDSATAVSLAFGRLYLAQDLGMQMTVRVFALEDPQAPRLIARQHVDYLRFPRQLAHWPEELAAFTLDQRLFVVDPAAPETLLAMPLGADRSILAGSLAYRLQDSDGILQLMTFRTSRDCLLQGEAPAGACDHPVQHLPAPTAGVDWRQIRMGQAEGSILALITGPRWLVSMPQAGYPEAAGWTRSLAATYGPVIEHQGRLYSVVQFGAEDYRLRISPAGWSPASAIPIAELALPAALELTAIGEGVAYLRGEKLVSNAGLRHAAAWLQLIDIRDPARPGLIELSESADLDPSATLILPPLVYSFGANRQSRESELSVYDYREAAEPRLVERLTIAPEIKGQRRLVSDGQGRLAALWIPDGRRLHVAVLETGPDNPGRVRLRAQAELMEFGDHDHCCMYGRWGMAAARGLLYLGGHGERFEQGKYGLDGELITIDLRGEGPPRLIRRETMGIDAITDLIPGRNGAELFASTGYGEIHRIDLREPDRPRLAERLYRLPLDGLVRPEGSPRMAGMSWTDGRLYLSTRSANGTQSRGVYLLSTD